MVTTSAEDPSSSASLSKGVRILYGVLDLLTAGVAAALAVVLWTANPVWIVVLWAWVAFLVGSAIGLFAGTRMGRLAARAAAVFQLGLMGVLIFVILASVAFLWGVYGQIGTGIAAALLLVFAIILEFMGLLPVFKLRALGLFERTPSANTLENHHRGRTRAGARCCDLLWNDLCEREVRHLGADACGKSATRWRATYWRPQLAVSDLRLPRIPAGRTIVGSFARIARET